MSLRCLWDADTDNYAEDVFINVGPLVMRVDDKEKKTFFSFLLLSSIGQSVLCSDGVWKLLLLRTEGWL